MMPSLFISHGAPDLVLHELPARQFLAAYSTALPRPRAILVASAHYTGAAVQVTTGETPTTIHDFDGFPPALHALRYPAPGAPALAARVRDACTAAGLPCVADPHGGYDHGVWCPLLLLYPAADIPVVALGIAPRRDAAWHYALGRVLAPLREEGVLVIGSGALTHNLYEVAPPAANDAAPEWVDAFADWIGARLAAGDEAALLEWTARAPHAAANHPSAEHLLPLFVALGAAGSGWRATRIHRSVSYRALRMDCFRFDA
ncbi:MAG TPA: class III extradiol ring-cleavage dioxygenase [Gammaproteobacteria bacterium]|nr:class III extradiol ring-cleavage dioxygenase [Gammaproteobacteria bacterium]